MSYNTYILIDTGGIEPATVEDCGNYTSNVGPMYRAVMPGPYQGGGCHLGNEDPDPRGGLTGISGLRCTAAATILADGVRQMVDRSDEMSAMNPENGWGSCDTALKYLEGILSACRRHPKGYVAVSW